MEPKKLFGSIGVILTTIASIVLFIVEYDKIKKFFFPESVKLGISLQFYVLSIMASNAIVFYILYIYYYAEKEKNRKAKIEVENAKQQLIDAEKLRLLDFVTGIPNEQKFIDDLEKRPKELFQLIIIDLDGFGEINKKYGFQKGDEVIRIIAQELHFKMRRDEEIYKRDYKMTGNFIKRIYRKYTGGDEFIFLIKGQQHEAVGFLTRTQKQLNQLNTKLIELNYQIKFHAAIVSVHPNDTYKSAIDKLQRAYVHAAEEKNNLRVFWDQNEEEELKGNFGLIYDNAKAEFMINKLEF